MKKTMSNTNKITEGAARLARRLHKGQVDKAVMDYFSGHLTTVASMGTTWQEQVVGYLHDASEDTSYSVDRILDLLNNELGKPLSVEDRGELAIALRLLNHHTAPDRETYIRSIGNNALATAVKLHDLTHNMDLSRLVNPNEKDYARIERYRKEYDYLKIKFKAKMKRTLLSLLTVFLLTSCSSYISYTYRPLAAEGCSVRYSANYQEGKPYLFVEIQSDRLMFGGKPILMVKTFKGEIFTLEGISIATSQESSGVIVGNMVLPITELQAKALFPITEDQISLLNDGIAKVRISTVPITHERTFSQDIIGKRLYNQFESTKKKAREF